MIENRRIPTADRLHPFYERYHCYVFASAHAKGRRVLDLCAGTGDGAVLLAAHADEVVGVCPDSSMAARANRRWGLEHLRFIDDENCSLSTLGDFEVVTVFDFGLSPEAFRDAIAIAVRFLSTTGLLIVSTSCFDSDELSSLLGEGLEHVRIWGQIASTGSTLLDLTCNEGTKYELTTIARDGDGWTTGIKPVPDRLLAMASNATLPETASLSILTEVGFEAENDIRLEREGLLGRITDLEARYDETLAALRQTERASARFLLRQEAVIAEARRAAAQSQQWQHALRELERARLHRFLRWLRSTLERVAPLGSLRRRAYSRVVSLLPGRTVEEHPKVEPSIPTVPMALEPEVSIVIPVHNQWNLTADCLRSIASDYSAVGYEVVVVDDASDDETATKLQDLVGISLVRLNENRGFIGAINAGLEGVRGRFVVLLNNDTVVEAGWLDALVATAESDPDVGIVGAKLVYPDGRLQEAGGIIWSDGSGHNYGRDQNPDDPAYSFVREVDYCSGACLLIRRELLALLGGLDSRFTPAYYEDTDICFAARKHGYRVLYQPAAVVQHLEGGSHGTDLNAGIKQHQLTNQAIFQEKWADELLLQSNPDPARPRLSSWRTAAGRALVIDHQLPMPDHDSGSLRMFELLCVLRDLGLGVTFVPQNGIELPQYRDALTSRGIEVLGGPHDLDPYLSQVGPALRLVLLSRPTVAWANLPMIRSLVPGTPIIYDTVDLHFRRERRRALVEGDSAAEQSARYHYDIELTLARLTDQSWAISELEGHALLAEDPSLNVAVVPNIHRDQPLGLPFEHREGLLFLGSYSHHPNRDAAKWLVEEILPLVRHRVPGVPLYLVGSYPTEEIMALAGDGITVIGWVRDLEEIYQRSRVFAAPLRYGAGMKGKIGESLAFGLPVVTTPVGAEGMGLRHGHDVLVGETPQALADLIGDLYTNQTLWNRLAHNGRRTISQKYSPASVRRHIASILEPLGVPYPGA